MQEKSEAKNDPRKIQIVDFEILKKWDGKLQVLLRYKNQSKKDVYTSCGFKSNWENY